MIYDMKLIIFADSQENYRNVRKCSAAELWKNFNGKRSET